MTNSQTPSKAPPAESRDELSSGGKQTRVAAGVPQAAGPEPPMSYTFKIFRDWSGMYRWLLTDQAGHRVKASSLGFAALSGAFRDAEVMRTGQYAGARIRDETRR